jgi:hypothetical protein
MRRRSFGLLSIVTLSMPILSVIYSVQRPRLVTLWGGSPEVVRKPA